MNYYSFEYPWLVLLLLPILFCLYKCKEIVSVKYFVHLHFLKAGRSFKHLEQVVKLLIFIFLVTALTSPIRVDLFDPLNRSGKEIVLAIDASGSMNASGFDLEGRLSKGERLSRFELTQMVAKEFIHKRSGDNVGVVLFGDFAFIASPITYEKEIVAQMIDYLTQGMAGQNTAIGEAIAVSVRAFLHSKAKSKVIVLLTDGEQNSGAISIKDALRLAKEQNIKIYTIGIGEAGEADVALLQKIAQESGALCFSAKSVEELEKVYEQIDELENTNISAKEYKQKEYFYQTPILLAVMGLLFLLYREFGR